MAEKNYSGTGKPNTSIAGAKGTGTQTGDRTQDLGMPNHAGTGANDYEKTLKDSEKEPGGKAPTSGKKGKPKKFGSIQALRDEVKRRGIG